MHPEQNDGITNHDHVKSAQNTAPKEHAITLHAAGPIPGIPGHHGPGDYLVNYEARTIRPLPALLAEEQPKAEHSAKAEHAPHPLPDHHK